MSKKLYSLILVDDDRIFRMGMRSWLEQFSDFEVVSETDTAEATLAVLRGNAEDKSLALLDVDLVILDLNLGRLNSEFNKSDRLSGLGLCQQLKSIYPDLPILLLSSSQTPELVAAALRTGVEGYCLKGTNSEELITAIRQIAAGNPYLGDRFVLENNQMDRLISNLPDQPVSVVAILRHNLYLSGLRRIDRALEEVRSILEEINQDRLTQIVLAGQERELRMARWLLDRLWGKSKKSRIISQSNDMSKVANNLVSNSSVQFTNMQVTNANVEISGGTHPERNRFTDKPNILTIQSILWDKTVEKLQSNLLNLSKTPLEIDILKEEKKRELLYIALRQTEQSLTELRFSEIQPSELQGKLPTILKNIWQETVINFFGKYYSLIYIQANNCEVNIVDVLLKDVAIVQMEFLDKIPQVDNLLSHLLFETELVVDNNTLAIGNVEAMQRAEIILDNLLIQIANGVIQPLLNHFADAEEIKQKFYRYNLLPTREIEKFRNDLSWKYRLEKYLANPKSIFESRHILFAFSNLGIKKTSIYAARSQELQQLEGIQLAVTLVLEFQDAIAPRLKSAIAFLGTGLVYLLTNVLGKGIGLIGQGVLKGIGNAWQENRSKK